VCAALATRASGQTYEVIHAFTIPASQPVAGLVEGTDGFFYGTTRGGGAAGGGTVFRIDSAGALTTLHTFAYEDGNDPEAGLVQATDGKFYGTTYGGGAHGFGTIFRIDSAGTLNTLYSFAGKDFNDGSNPVARLVQATDGNFYGTTSTGGTGFNDLGTVFRMTPAGAVTILHTFTGSDGVYPVAGLVQSAADGKLYGTTQVGGGGSGTVFSIDTAGTTFTSLHSFAISDGAAPSAALVAANGKFYGTTKSGGSGGFGTVFSIDSVGTFATIKHLGAGDGHAPTASLILATDGKLYGTTSAGGASDLGTVFRIDFAGTLTTLHPFVASEGSAPLGNVVQGTDGLIYGTAKDGGANAGGTAFKMTTAGALTKIHDFGGPSAGYEPESGLLQAGDGNLYGTTFWGGAAGNFGTIFKLTLAGARTTLHDFTDADGSAPWAKLVQLADGKLYGTTSRGGASHWGAAFSVTLAGSYALLHSFDGSDGLGPRDAALVLRPADSMLYGMTEAGGTGYGNAFKMTTAGAVTSIHAFTLADGALPSDGLLLGTDGNFYGTTASGGTAVAQGNVVRITPAGAVTVLHEFNHTQGADDDGMYPMGGLVRATDGNLYGTTRAGGANTEGNVFRISSAGTYATIHSFTGADGREPYGNLLQASDGKLYGTTYGGGAHGHGTIFAIDTAGTNFAVLHSLTLEEGAGPVGGLIQATDGKLYGVTNGGGPGKAGVVFRLTLPGGCTPPPPPTAGNDGPKCAGQTLQLSASTIAGATYAWTGPNGFASSAQNPSIPSATPAASGTYSVTATVAGCASAPATTSATVNPLPSAVVTAPSSVCPGAAGQSASVPDAGGSATYAWTITNGTITAGAGTRSITFTAGTSGSVALGVTVTSASGCARTGSASVPISASCTGSKFYGVTPCRIADTRNPNGPLGGPALTAGTARSFPVTSTCGVPAGARALSLNLTVVAATTAGALKLYADGASVPVSTALSYHAVLARANNAIAAPSASGLLAVVAAQPSGTVHVILDVNGYFK
jgi:uncharacterized repeat protein (TIGR03803 family)